MKLLLAVVMILAIGGLWYYNDKTNAASEQAAIAAQNHKPFQPVGSSPVRTKPVAVTNVSAQAVPAQAEPDQTVTAQAPRYSCDGRTHCSHMRSCEEAKFFIQNCPNTSMDGNNDGVPCERQWC